MHDLMVLVQVSQDPVLNGYVKIRHNVEVYELNRHFWMPGQKTMFLEKVYVEDNVTMNVTLSSKTNSAVLSYSIIRKFVSV